MFARNFMMISMTIMLIISKVSMNPSKLRFWITTA